MDRRYFLFALSALPVQAQPKPPTLSLTEVQQALFERIQSSYRGRLQVSGEPLPGIVRLIRQDQTSVLLFMAGIYRKALAWRSGSESFLRSYLDPLAAPLTWDEAQGQLLPRLLATRRLRELWGKETMQPLTQALHPDLLWSITVDIPDVIWPVTPLLQKTWGVKTEEIQQAALGNLTARTDIPVIVAGERGGVWVVNRGDSYDAERILVTPLLQAIRAEKAMPLLVSAPSPNWLVITAAQDQKAAGRLQAVIKRIHQSEASIALPSLIFRFDQQLEPYL